MKNDRQFPHGGGVILAIPLSLALWGVFFWLIYGCASPNKVGRFPLNHDYSEIIADPGVVNLKCYDNGKGRKDDGSRKKWNDSYCGCVDFKTKTVWLSKHPVCAERRWQTRLHENEHIKTGPSMAARAETLRKYP